jgi:hypothetical protein
VRESVEQASPVDVERSSFIFKAIEKIVTKMVASVRNKGKLYHWRKNYQFFTLRVFVLRDDFSERINRVIRGIALYEYEVPGVGALNLNSTNYTDHGHHGDPPLSGTNPHGGAGNRTRDFMISSQKR